MNETLKDIHVMLAKLWIWHDGAGHDAYNATWFKTFAEKYGFICNSYEEAKKIIKDCSI